MSLRSERVKGDRKVRVRVAGSDARALQDAVDFLGGRSLPSPRRKQVRERLAELVKRYKLMDDSAQKAKGK